MRKIYIYLTGLLLLIGQNAFAQPQSGTKTIGPSGNFATLTAAFTSLTSSGVNGAVVLELQANYSSGSETYPITIGSISGTSATNSITVRPATGATGLSISSSSSTATIDLNGAKYVTFDGRPGASGSSIAVGNTTYLTIANTSTAGVTIRMINDASNNSIRYCDLQGVNATNGEVPGTAAGIVFIGTTVGSNGNDNNVIDNCNLHPPSAANMCTMGIYSYGPAGASSVTANFNDSNTISNCNIYDFNGGTANTSAGIELDKGTNAWVISNNSFFQTVSRTPTITANVTCRGIYINTVNSTGVGNGFTITGNSIGGMAPKCGSTAFTINSTGSFNSLFDGITLVVAGGNTSNVKSNVITNLNISQGASTSDLFHGIWCKNTGNVNVGGPNVSDGNIIGSSTATGAIVLNSQGAGLTHNPILVISGPATSSTTILFQNNTVGGFDLLGAGCAFSGIFCNATSPTVIIDRNLIGSLTVNNSINASSTSSSYVLFVNGIRSSSGSAILTITNNVIANLTNSNTNSTTSSGITNTSLTQTGGIVITGPSTATQIVNSISGNWVKNLSCASFQTSNYVNTVLVGIGTVAAGGSPTIIANNVVDSLVNTSTGTGTSQNILMTGIFYYGTTSNTTLITGNQVHSFMISANNPGCTWRGIEVIGGPVTVANNMIRLGTKPDGTDFTNPILLYALLTEATTVHNVFHNTVVVSGANVTGSDVSYAYWRYNLGTDDIRNNIFMNVRSNATGATGKHYAINLVGTGSMTLNNNIYYASGSGTVFAYNGSADVASYTANWVSGDANSYATDPGLISAGGSATALNLHLSQPGNKGASIVATGIPDDIDGDLRSTLPDIGADEVPIDIGISAIDAPTTTPFCGQLTPIIVRLKNYGLQTVTSATIKVTINGSPSFFYNWSGSLSPGQTSSAINIGSYNFSGGAYKLSVHSALTGNAIDAHPQNDTTHVQLTVTPSVFPTISISTPITTVCINTPVTFKATYSQGGASPLLQWKVNGVNAGSPDTVYSSSSLNNSDTVTCTLTSNATCALPSSVTSSFIRMTVGVTLKPTITVSTADTVICAGNNSNFKATISNGGSTPHYQWRRNGLNVGTDSSGFKLINPSNNDTVTCILLSNLSCASQPRDTSAPVIITVKNLITPSVSITASALTICDGVNDTFVATPVNGGTAPTYLWRLNSGQGAGSNGVQLITSTLKDKDSVYVLMTSNAPCLTQQSVTSSKIMIRVNPVVSPTATVSVSSSSLCSGQQSVVRSVTSNGGTQPQLTWYKNGTIAASGIDSLLLSSIADKDSVWLVYTSNAGCLKGSPSVTSNHIQFSVSPYVTPTVTVTTASLSICAGTQVKLSAIAQYGGVTHFAWKLNGQTIGTDDSVFVSNTINNKDTISVVMTSSLKCVTKSSDTSVKQVFSVSPLVTPTIVVSTATQTVCQAVPVAFGATLNGGGSSPHIQWKKNGQNTGMDSTGLFLSSLTNKDTVYAVLTSNAPCVTSATVVSNKLLMTVTPQVNASLSISEGANNVCEGTPITFYSNPVNGGLKPVYHWFKNSQPVGTDSSRMLLNTLKNGDTIMLHMTSSIACAVPDPVISNAIVMQLIPYVTPDITVSPAVDSVCSGGLVTLTAIDVNGISAKSISWLKNAVKFATDTLKVTTTISQGDKIKVVLKALGQCVTKATDTADVIIKVNPIPAKPVISRVRDTLRTSASGSYQWFLNNTLIPGATQQQYVATSNGSYKVMVTVLGCSNTSDTIGFYSVGLASVELEEGIFVYPNPVIDRLHIVLPITQARSYQLQITDMFGRQVQSSESGLTGHQEIQVSGLPTGIYFLTITDGNKSQVTRFSKTE